MGVIAAFFNQECVIHPFIRHGGGETIYGEDETRPCRLEEGKHLRTTYKNPNGQIEQVEARAKLFCEGEEIPTSSIVTCDGKSYIVVDCHGARGFFLNHQEAYLM